MPKNSWENFSGIFSLKFARLRIPDWFAPFECLHGLIPWRRIRPPAPHEVGSAPRRGLTARVSTGGAGIFLSSPNLDEIGDLDCVGV